MPLAGVTELMLSPPLESHSSWMPPEGDSNRTTPSGEVPDPVMSFRTMIPALPKPVMFCCAVTSVSMVAVVPAAPGW